MRNASDWFTALFQEFEAEGRRSGMVKIDVEGYERQVISALLAALPPSMSIMVVFENWLPHFDPADFASSSHGQDWFYFAKAKRRLASIPFKLLGLSSAYRHEVRPLTKDVHAPHDIVMLAKSL